MAWGIGRYGLGPWGSGDFTVINHAPADNSTGNPRLTTISFTLSTLIDPIDLSTIDLTVNSVPLITNGVFTANAMGTINAVSSILVNVTATVTHAFAPLEVVTVVVAALTFTLDAPGSGTTWQFTVNDTTITASNYIVNRFEKVLRVNVIGLDAPQHPMALPE